MQDKNYKSSNLIKRKKKILLLKVWMVAILVILLIGGTAYLSTIHAVKISEIQVNDTSFFDKKEVEEIVRTELEGSYLFIFNKDNIFLFPRHTIKQKVKEHHQAIQSVSLHITGPHSISVTVHEYTPSAVWCNTDNCYYLNEEGFIFIQAPIDYDRNLIQFHDWIHDDPIGKTYTDSDTFKKMMVLINLVAKVPLKVVSVNTEDGLTFFLHTDSNTRLLYEINDNPEEVASNLNTVIEKDAISRAQLNNIDYIDLRFGNKVYYKIR